MEWLKCNESRSSDSIEKFIIPSLGPSLSVVKISMAKKLKGSCDYHEKPLKFGLLWPGNGCKLNSIKWHLYPQNSADIE